jgi:hypothetical protein
MNTVNYAQTTNIMAGSDVFKIVPFYLQTISVPGISFSHPELGGRLGSKFALNADSITYGDLSFTIIMDEDLIVYDELLEVAKSQMDFATGVFTEKSFDFWISVTDSTGKDTMKWTFHNAKLESIADMQYDYSSDETSFTVDVTLKYDHFDYKNLKKTQNINSSVLQG